MRWVGNRAGRGRARVELAFAAGLFAFGAAWAVWFLLDSGASPQFFQREFSPALSLACGQGFAGRSAEMESSALLEFLEGGKETFDCSQLRGPDQPLNGFQKGHLYLIGAVGVLWKLLGISWSSLLPLYALLSGLTSTATYGLMRLCAGRLVAAGASVLLAMSLLARVQLPNLRDYAKAPFILWLLLILLWLVTGTASRARKLALSAIAGAIVGLGVGFRMDLILFVPAYVATLLLFQPGGVRANFRVAMAGCAVFLAVFLALAWPVLAGVGEGSNAYHVIALGLMSPFDKALGIAPAVYEWGYLYNDVYAQDMINDFARRVLAARHSLELATVEYDRAGAQFLATLAAHYPADLVTRYLASVVKVLQSAGPAQLFGSYAGHFAFLDPVSGAMPWLAGVALVVVASKSLRLAIFGLGLVLFLCGYPSLQFDSRHYFHLQVVPVWIFTFLVMSGLAAARHRRGAPAPAAGGGNADGRGAWVRGALLVVAGAAVVWAGLLGLRHWQQSHLVAQLRTVEAMPARRVEAPASWEGDLEVRRLRDSGPGAGDLSAFRATDYWVAELDGPSCGLDVVEFGVVYEASAPYYDASHTFQLRIGPRTRYFFPTFAISGREGSKRYFRRLRGVAIPREASRCLLSLGRVEDLSSVPMLNAVLLRPGWEDEPLFQRIGGGANPEGLRRATRVVTPAGDPPVLREQSDRLMVAASPIDPRTAILDSPLARIREGGFDARGKPWLPYTYLLRAPPRKLAGHGYLVADVEVFEGGVSVGVLRDERWVSQAHLVEPGRFRAVLRVGPGTYTAVVANNVPDRRPVHARIERLAWVEE